jgi:hypothetical protein
MAAVAGGGGHPCWRSRNRGAVLYEYGACMVAQAVLI